MSNEACSGTYPLSDQTREARIWGNTWQPIPGYDQDSIWIDSGCEPYLQEGRDFFRAPKSGYTPYPYPHPLRGVTAPLAFYPVTPCRLVDTRGNAGALGGPALAAGEERSLPIVASACGPPADAKAVSVNLTVVSPAASGSLTLFPGDQSQPMTGTVSFRSGTTRASNAVLALAFDGTGGIRVKNTSSAAAHCVIDLNGYFR